MSKNILVLTSWSYHDALIQTYTLPYLKIAASYLPETSTIHLVSQEQGVRQLKTEELPLVNQALDPWRIKVVPSPYTPFGGRAMLGWLGRLGALTRYIHRHRITHIHAFCTPAGGIGYLLSRLTGRPLILDSFEPHAEAMVENGTWAAGSLPYRILLKLEKWQYNRASAIISATSGMQVYANRTYGSTKKMLVKPACVDLELFNPAKNKQAELLQELGLNDKLVCVYAGKFGGIYLDQEVFDFFSEAYTFWGDKFRVLLLTNQDRSAIDAWCAHSGLPGHTVIDKFVAHSQVADYLGLGDFAITPVKPVPTKRYCTPIKNGEYWALGLPVVSTANISDDSDIIEENQIGALIPCLNRSAYRGAIEQIDLLLLQPRQALSDKIRNIARKYRSFSIAESVYQAVYGK